MDVNKLVRMVNQIAQNLDYGSDKDRVVTETAAHLKKFWTPSMKQEILEHFRSGDTQLSSLAAQAIARLDEEQSVVS